jgi:hypothetical protein
MVTREHEPQPRVADYRRVLRKHRWLITGIFLLTVLTVAIWTFVQVPIYQAVATILIEPEPPKVLNIQDVTPVGAMSPWDPAFYPTQYEIIKSRAVVVRAVDALNLRTRAADGGGAGWAATGSRWPRAEHAAGPDQGCGPRSGARGRRGERRRERLCQGQCRAQAEGGEGRAGLALRGGGPPPGEGRGVLAGAAELPGQVRHPGHAGAAADQRPEDHRGTGYSKPRPSGCRWRPSWAS